MEHSCYQCGASVEDGIPFCRQCNAPQIRVATAEANGPAEMISESFSPAYSTALPATRINWPHVLRAASLAGLLGVILIIILRQAFVLAMLTSGLLSVYFYRRRNPFSNLTAGMGALLGAMSAVFGTVFLAVPCILSIIIVRSNAESRAALVAAFKQQVAASPDAHLQEFLEYAKTPEGITALLVIAIVTLFIAFLVLSSLGGAIAAAMLRRKQRL